jgi:hypothetical protein
MRLLINDITVSGEGFNDFVMTVFSMDHKKRVIGVRGYQKVVKICVTSFIDDPNDLHMHFTTFYSELFCPKENFE